MVCARAVRVNYGVRCRTVYDPSNEDHVGRETFIRADGNVCVGGKWRTVVPKVSDPGFFC